MPTVTTYPGVFGPYTPITFTRASTATYFDSTGTLQSAANNVPRLDYNPSTLAAQGLLIEEARTNGIIWSESFRTRTLTVTITGGTFTNGETVTATGGGTGTYIAADSTPTSFAIFNGSGTFSGTLTGDTSGATATISASTGAWTNSNSTISANAAVAPTGATVADKLVENTANSQHSISVISVLTTGIQYTISVFAKSAERSIILLGAVKDDGNFVGRYFNLATGVSTASFGTPDSWSISSVGNGWYRCVVTITNSATGSSDSIGVYLVDSGTNTTYTGDGTSGIFIWGAQLEAGAFPTSYIPTTTTALTRSADVASVNTLSPWFNATEGTLFVDSTVPYTVPASSFPTTSAFTDGTNNNRLDVGYITSAVASMASVVGGVTTAEIYPAVSASNRRNAFAYKTNDFAGCSNGGAVGTATSGALPTVDRLLIGSLTTGNRLNGYLRRIVYYPRRLSNAELQSITS